MKFFILAGLLSSLPVLSALACSSIQELKTVGQADLTVWGFSVYSARTLSCSGEKISDAAALPRPFALELTYARDISRQDLLDNTREQWQRLGLYRSDSEVWLEQLSAMWPSVTKGDRLTLYLTPKGASEFYFADNKIGEVTEPIFGTHFLAIWLDQNASYQKARKKLLGDIQ